MTEKAETRVTGKQVLVDALTFAKDAGAFIFELGRRVFFAIKNALQNEQTEEQTVR